MIKILVLIFFIQFIEIGYGSYNWPEWYLNPTCEDSYICGDGIGATYEKAIIRALGDVMSIDMPFDNILELRELICNYNPIFKQLNILNNNSFSLIGKKGNILDEPIKDLIDNFYMTDPISRTSKTMAKCSSSSLIFNKEKIN